MASISLVPAVVAAWLVAASTATESSCQVYGEICAEEGDEVSLIQGRQLLAKRSRQTPGSGPFASRRSCRNLGDGTSQCFPDIMLVGASKAGTTSVASALKHHPYVDMQRTKGIKLGNKPLGDEVHIFDYHHVSHEVMTTWHWDSAPVLPQERVAEALQLHYTPNYMYYPDAPFNIYDVYPNVDSIKYLFMVRDPTRRAVSGWKFHRQVTWDIRSFEKVVDDGISERHNLEACYEVALRRANATVKHVEDLPMRAQKKVIDECFWGRSNTHDTTTPLEMPVTLMHAHVDKGIYVDQLRRWFSIVGRENCLVFSLEEWAANETAVFMDIMNFTGLQGVGPHGYKDMETLNRTLLTTYNDGDGFISLIPEPSEPSQHLKDKLDKFFKPYNEELFKLVGRRLF